MIFLRDYLRDIPVEGGFVSKKGRKNSPSVFQSNPVANKAFDKLFSACLKQAPSCDEEMLMASGADFATFSEEVRLEIELFQKRIANISFFALISLWGQVISKDRVFGEKYLGMMQSLLDAKIFDTIPASSKGKITVKDFASLPRTTIIDAIRCHQEWSIEKREEFVLFYLHFSEWVSKETFGIIAPAEDFDRSATSRRKLSFSDYLEILKNIGLRERILVKIFYLGGALELGKVLSTDVKALDFDQQTINFDGDPVRFPRHLFVDLKAFLEGRKRGYIFTGRGNEKINHTVPYRMLKSVVTKLGMKSDFTFKDFAKNH